MNETKSKGLVTELQCQTFFTKLGYNVSIPLGEDCRYDMILDVNGLLLRIQVKTCHSKNNNSFTISTRSTQCNSKGSHNISYSKEQIDLFATYYNNTCYLIPVEECSSTKTLVLNKNVNNQNVAKNYEAKTIIDKIENQKCIIYSDSHVYQYDLNGRLLDSFISIREAARQLGDVRKNTHISQCICGKRKTAYGFIWTDTLITNKTF